MKNQIWIGIDMIEVARLASLKPEIQRRFIDRVFTEKEQAICGMNFQRLSGRFACKEAVCKALGTGIGKVGWRDIETLNQESGQPILYLHGAAAETAALLGINVWSISITHLREIAAAVAVGVA